MKTVNYYFFDFDGSLIDTPLPEYGKPVWEDAKKQKYPHLGWWGRPESLDLSVFNIQANPVVKKELLDAFDRGDRCWILTSRIPKLEQYVKAILSFNGIDIDKFAGFSFFSALDKGERIFSIIKKDFEVNTLVNQIHVYEDREKEFVAIEKSREAIEVLVNELIVHKVDIDYDLGRK